VSGTKLTHIDENGKNSKINFQAAPFQEVGYTIPLPNNLFSAYPGN